MNENMPTSGSGETTQLIPMLKTLFSQFLAHWKWFLLSVVICGVLGYIYLQRQTPVYQRQAVMLFEDPDGGGAASKASRRGSSGMSALLELNGISVGGSLKNETFILTSRRLMERVVDTLHLDVDYTTRESLHDVALYRNRPFEVVFENNAKDPYSFKVEINEDKTFTLYDFELFDVANQPKDRIKMRQGETKNTPVGRLSIRPDVALADFPVGKAVKVSHFPKKLAAKFYAANVAASEYDKESSLVVLTCQDVDPHRAEDVVRALYESYKQDVVDNKNRMAHNTANFIDDRIRLIGEDLNGIENRLADFKRNNQVVDFEKNAQLYLTENSQARSKTIELETNLAVANYLKDFLADRSKKHETVPVLSLDGSSLSPLITEYNRVMIERNRVMENSSEMSPSVRELDRSLDELRNSLSSSLLSYVQSLRLQLNHARDVEQKLMGRLGSAPDAEREGLDIIRQQELKSALYTYLLNKREEVALRLAIEEANVRLVEGPLGNPFPISPKSKIIYLLSLILGLMIPAGVLWLRYAFDVKISERQEIENATSAPVAGEIPMWEEKNEQSLLTNTSTDSPIMEAFRLLRYGFNFIRHSAKVIVVTSSSPGQGKTFVSSNLAYVLGLSGKRVLYVDADIRKHTVSRILGNASGLVHLFSEEGENKTIEDVIIPGVLSDNVDFLPAGKIPPNPTELLMSERFDEIIDQARALYDYVIVDTTPALVVADAGVVSRVADITAFVLRLGVERKDFLPIYENIFQSRKFKNVCTVINGTDRKHGYGYNYGYGYGYSHDTHKKKKRFFGLF